MSFIRNLVRRAMGRSIEVLDLEIKFHKEANLYGRHGHLIASHKEQGLEGYPVRFVFVGVSRPPALTPRVMEYIWDEAKAQGYIPERLYSYDHILDVHEGLPAGCLVSQERRLAENQFHGIASDAMPAATRALAAADSMASLTNKGHVGQSDASAQAVDVYVESNGLDKATAPAS